MDFQMTDDHVWAAGMVPISTPLFDADTRVVELVAENHLNRHGVVTEDQAAPGAPVLVLWDGDQYTSLMSADNLRRELSPAFAGCWLDGSQGWHNSYRVVEDAVRLGFVIDADARLVLDWYREHGASAPIGSDAVVLTLTDNVKLDALTAAECVAGQGGMTEEATDYLSALCPVGHAMEWDMGELCMVEISDDD